MVYPIFESGHSNTLCLPIRSDKKLRKPDEAKVTNTFFFASTVSLFCTKMLRRGRKQDGEGKGRGRKRGSWQSLSIQNRIKSNQFASFARNGEICQVSTRKNKMRGCSLSPPCYSPLPPFPFRCLVLSLSLYFSPHAGAVINLNFQRQ